MRDGIEDASRNISESDKSKLEATTIGNMHILISVKPMTREKILFISERRNLISIGDVLETLINEESERLERI